MRRLWRAYVRAGAIKEHLLRNIMPARMRFVHYGWPLRADVCPCDVHFFEYLVEQNVRQKSIFHFGSGGHHIVGLRNHYAGTANHVLALTISPREHAAYVRRVIREPSLGKSYKVMFADIYSLSAASLPMFDVITLFHLCEFAPAGDPAQDREVLRLFCSKLSPGGSMMFYPGSFGYPRLRHLIQQAQEAGWLALAQQYKSLTIFKAPERE